MRFFRLTTAILPLVLFTTGCEEENVIAEVDPASKPAAVAPTSKPAAAESQSTANTDTSSSNSGVSAASAGALTPPSDRPKLEKGVADVQQIDIMDIMFIASEEWRFREPSNQMRLAEAILAQDSATGDEVLMTIFYFGKNGGGTAASNLSRWADQVSTEEEPVIYQYEQADLVISEIMSKGTLVPTGMGTGPSSPQPDMFMFGVIVEGGPQGNIYLKATGPQSLLEEVEPSLYTMTETFRVVPEELREPSESPN